MFDEFLRKSEEFRGADEPFAIALVVRSTPPISGKPGDKAIIRLDGSLWGWIGGGCAQPVVIKESLKALQDGKPRLVRISPNGELETLDQPTEGVKHYPMKCHSGGDLDIYIEPILPTTHIVILGQSPVAQTLARLAKDIRYSVSVLAPGASSETFPCADLVEQELDLAGINVGPAVFIVVSTQGEDDEQALSVAVNSEAEYVGFVASRTKAQKIIEYLEGKGVDSERLARVKAPAGIDIKATTPEDIAVSILAEIIETRAKKGADKQVADKQVFQTRPEPASRERVISIREPEEFRDPVCGMTVDPRSARHKSKFTSGTIYFCCERCKDEFEKHPERYLTGTTETSEPNEQRIRGGIRTTRK